MKPDEYLKPIKLTGRAWAYVERRGLCVVVRHGDRDTETVTVTWERLDRLRKQAEKAKP